MQQSGFHITVTPPLQDEADLVDSQITRKLPKAVRDGDRDAAKVVLKAVKRRARRVGSGRVRVGRAMKTVDTLGGGFALAARQGYPDLLGQEYGSHRFRQFARHKRSGYVIGAVIDDRSDMEKAQDAYTDEIDDLMDMDG